MSRRSLPILACVALLGCTGREIDRKPPVDQQPGAASATVAELIEARQQLSSFRRLMSLGGIELPQTGSFTVFAPTEEAFSKVPKADLERLLSNADHARKLAQFHILSEALLASEIVPGTAVTLNGHRVVLSKKGTSLYVNEARVTAIDVLGANGVVHEIDTLLVPPL